MLSLLKLEQILKLTGYGRSTFYNLLRARQWPQPIKVSARSNRWLSTEVDAMIRLMTANSNIDEIQAKVKELEDARSSGKIPS
jgi:prophage regulatory protein